MNDIVSKRVVAAVLIGLVLCPHETYADPVGVTVFDTFGPGSSFDPLVAWSVEGNTEFHAFRFVPSRSGALNQITVALFGVSNVQQQARFDVYSGSSTAPEILLETHTVPNTAGLKVATMTSALRPALLAGENYWLLFTEPDSPDGFSAGWHWNNLGLFGTHVSSFASGPRLDVLPAFRISAVSDQPAPIPEPGALTLVATGFVALVRGWRRRQRLSGSSAKERKS